MIRERVTVRPGGKIEILHPELPAGTEVVVLVEQGSGERQPTPLRESLRHYLASHRRQVPPGAGAFDSGHTSTAENAEEILDELGFGGDAD
jgi:hypothetical protein